MLLWIPPSARLGGGSTTPSHHHHDDNEKGDKLRRRAAEARLRNILMAVGLFLLAFFATVSQVQYTQKRHHQPPSLRSISGKVKSGEIERPSQQQREVKGADALKDAGLTVEQEYEKEQQQQRHGEKGDEEPLSVDDFFVPHAHLPENSIYRLTMTDVTENPVDLGQFSGMVSLVVNTACH